VSEANEAEEVPAKPAWHSRARNYGVLSERVVRRGKRLRLPADPAPPVRAHPSGSPHLCWAQGLTWSIGVI